MILSVLLVGDSVKGNSMPDISASEVLHTHIPAEKISGTGSPILNQIKLVNLGRGGIILTIL